MGRGGGLGLGTLGRRGRPLFPLYDDSFYELLPYEAITEEEYEARRRKMRPFNPSLISKYEHEETELDIGAAECANGVCPVR